MENERLTMTIEEFAKVTGCSRGLIYDLARRDALPIQVLRFGRRMLLSRKAVEGLFSGGEWPQMKEVKHENKLSSLR